MILTVSCKQEQPTNLSLNYDKYLVQNDSDCVEVTDIDTLDFCFGPSYRSSEFLNEPNTIYNYKSGQILRSESEYKTIFDDAVAKNGKDFHYNKCDTIYKPTGVNFEKRFIVMHRFNGGDYGYERIIYKNKVNNEYLYLFKIRLLSNNEQLKGYWDYISLPLINNQASIKFDTILINFK